MNTNDTNRQKAHAMIDHIFKDLFPAQGMAERSEQIKLSHRMLDTMLNGGIALCDAGTGIGKTYAYLAAAAAANRSDTEALRKPVIKALGQNRVLIHLVRWRGFQKFFLRQYQVFEKKCPL